MRKERGITSEPPRATEGDRPKDGAIEEVMAEEKGRGRRRGVLDPVSRKQKRENLRVLEQFLVRKDTRGFLEFLRRHGIKDGTPEFEALYKLWHAEISKL